MFDAILDALKKGDKDQLLGFDNFEIRERAARTGRNPQTGEIQIAVGKTPARCTSTNAPNCTPNS